MRKRIKEIKKEIKDLLEQGNNVRLYRSIIYRKEKKKKKRPYCFISKNNYRVRKWRWWRKIGKKKGNLSKKLDGFPPDRILRECVDVKIE